MPLLPFLFLFGIFFAPFLYVLALAWLFYMGVTRGIPWLFRRYEDKKVREQSREEEDQERRNKES